MATPKKKLKTFIIKYTVWEYYQVEAYTREEAMKEGVENPFFCDYRTRRIVKGEK